MATQNYFIMTSAQRTTAMALNGVEQQTDPRAVDAASPGVGLNLNGLATGVAAGVAVDLVGKYLAPVRIVNDPAYIAGVPALVANLNTLPCAILENETVFAPVVV